MKAPPVIAVGTTILAVASLGAYFVTNRQNTGRVPEPQQSQAQPAKQAKQQTDEPKYKLLDSDPEYARLRRPVYETVDELPEYKAAIEKRESLIRAKVGNISDPTLYRTMADQVGETIPKVDRDKFYDIARLALEKQRAAYAEMHKDDYFIVALYEDYYPSSKIALFNICKSGNGDSGAEFARHNFGSGLRRIKEGSSDPATFSEPEYDLDSLGRPIDGVIQVISEDRYKRDFEEGCYVYHDSSCERLLAVTVSPEQMDGAYASVAKRFGSKIEELYKDEMRYGGDHPRYAHGNYIPHNPGVLRDKVTAYVRRQAIWIIGRGNAMDPNEVKVREAYLVVVNDQFGKLK